MPLHIVFKIMEVDMKESAFYNTSWQVQYFPLFMNSGAGKKIEMSAIFFLETNTLFYVFFSSASKILNAEEQGKWKEKKPIIYTVLLQSVHMVWRLDIQRMNRTDKLTRNLCDYLKGFFLSKRKL